MVTQNPIKILFVASEVEGLAKTGGLADVAKSLPVYLKERGHEVRVIMPFYKSMKHRERARFISSGWLPVAYGMESIPYNVHELQHDGITFHLIDCPRYFERDQLYAENNHAYDDNGERFAFFSAAALHSCELNIFQPDIVHCNDWHTALIPMLLKTRYANTGFFARTRSVISIHNAAFQGIFDNHQLWAVPEVLHNYPKLHQPEYSQVNFLKCGVFYADKITTVSPTYAHELLTYLGAHGMAQVFQCRAGDLVGIVNGCDYRDWDPATDPHLPQNYHIHDLSGKALCKQQLQQELSLPQENVPLYGMVCRLTEQKGVHLLIPALEKFLQHRVQVAIVGSGDPVMAEQLAELSSRYSDRFVFFNGYNDPLAHRVEAAADFFLMPSLFEPCGLNQMYSLAYGTLPLVRSVGGLKDTVVDYATDPTHANGFGFIDPTPATLLDVMRHSLIFFLQEQDEYRRIQQNAMATRFEWKDTVLLYEQLYRQVLSQ